MRMFKIYAFCNASLWSLSSVQKPIFEILQILIVVSPNNNHNVFSALINGIFTTHNVNFKALLDFCFNLRRVMHHLKL